MHRQFSIRRSLGSLKRRVWQSERFTVYALPDRPSVRSDSTLTFVGVNGFRRHADSTSIPALSQPYSGFQEAGDDGLLALDGTAVVGWLWVRVGPFDEAVGCGIAAIPRGLGVMRHVEVVPADRGRGVGRQLLAEAATRLRSQPAIDAIAFVGLNNVASQRAFDAAGYTPFRKVTFRRIFGRPIPVHASPERKALT